MKQSGFKAVACGIGFASSLVASLPGAAAQSVTPAPQLDLNRFVGVWYEEARLPNKPEKNCVRDAEVLYALADKPARLQIVNTCQIKDGSTNARNSTARRADKTQDGKLKVTTLFPFTKPYWVLAVGADYDWALVGSPNHKTLWVLSRTPVLPQDTLTQAEAKAAAQGFDTARLIPVAQRH